MGVMDDIGMLSGIAITFLLLGLYLWWPSEYISPEQPTIAEIEGKLDGLVSELPQTLPSIISDDIQPSPDPHYEQGGWLVVNQLDWHLAKESRFIKEEKLPLQASDVAYVVVISPARKVSAGYWKPRSALGGIVEKFYSEYTLYLVDWPNKRLVGKEIVYSSGGSYYESWEEDQDKSRRSILQWLYKRGVVEDGALI